MALDGTKTGKAVSAAALAADSKKYNKRPPIWKETDEERDQNEQTNLINEERPDELGPFIMDELYKQAAVEGGLWLRRVKKRFAAVGPPKCDEDLAGPYQRAVLLSERYKNEAGMDRMEKDLAMIREHVAKVHQNHRKEMSGLGSSPKKPRTPAKKNSRDTRLLFTEQPIEDRQDTIRQLSRAFASEPAPGALLMHEEEIARVRASYAYIYDRTNKPYGTRFPWDVAMRELCAIKAQATGRHKTVGPDFYAHFNMKHPKRHHT